ncbi:MAG: beta-ketoacyl synthase [Planctomycetaceae bacterium]
MAGSQSIRVVITGVGVVSPIGIGKDAFWQSLREGRSGVDYMESLAGSLPSPYAAEIKDFDPRSHLRDVKFLKVMSRGMQLGVSSASLAMRDSGIGDGDVDPNRLGVSFGAGRISTTPEEVADAVKKSSETEGDFRYTRWGDDSMGQIAPLWMLRRLPNMPAAHVSIDHNARGPNNTITCRDSSALLALAEATRIIERGSADCMIVGACSSNLQPVDLAKLNLFEGLTRRNTDPERAVRPFDFHRDGTILGEGAGSFVIERYEHAKARGAKIYAEIVGIGAGCDGTGYWNGAGGTGLVHAIRNAMRRGDLNAGEIGHINAHGKSTQREDLVEARAYHKVFGPMAERIPVTALKSYFGHFDAGSGAVEMVGSLLALEHGELPATLNYERPDPRCRLNIVHEGPMRLQNRTAMTVNRTAMGQSAAAIFRSV